MDLPRPPDDQELKNIIDKLASFVARNGYEFEQMTKQKQRDNPRFSFLYGGEHFHYYQYRVTSEQAFLRHQQQQMAHNPSANQMPMHHQQPHLGHMMVQPRFSNPSAHLQHHPQHVPFQQQFPPQQNFVQQSLQRGMTQQHPTQHLGRFQPAHFANHPHVQPSGNVGSSAMHGSQIAPSHCLNPSLTNAPGSIMPPGNNSIHHQNQISSTGNLNPVQPFPPFQSNIVQQTHQHTHQQPMQPMQQSLQQPLQQSLQQHTLHQPMQPSSQSPLQQLVHQPIQQQNSDFEIKELESKIRELKEQISQSESNLNAQHEMLTKQKDQLVEETIKKSTEETLQKHATDLELDLNEFDSLLQPILDSCTKDSISAGKSWISKNCNNQSHYEILCRFLQQKITATGLKFDQKLHIMYLINDLFSHSVRKQIEHLRRALNSGIVPIYSYTFADCEEDQQKRLIKLQKLWESNKYLDQEALQKLKDPQQTLTDYKATLIYENDSLVAPIVSATATKYAQLEKQHAEYVAHQQNKIKQYEQQIAATSQVQRPINRFAPNQGHTTSFDIYGNPIAANSFPPSHLPSSQQQIQQSQLNGQLHSGSSTILPHVPRSSLTIPNATPPSAIQSTGLPNPQIFNQISSIQRLPSPAQPQIPLAVAPAPSVMPLTASLIAPPTLPPPRPEVPYFDLPAGLMVPLVKLEDFEYTAIDPKDIRLPPPVPPSERLLKAVEEFYALPSHDRPRNAEGWEQLSLYEFFRAKSQAKKQLDEQLPIEDNLVNKSRNGNHAGFEDEDFHKKTVDKSRSRSRSRTSSRSRSRSYSSSRSSTSSRSRSRSSDDHRSYS